MKATKSTKSIVTTRRPLTTLAFMTVFLVGCGSSGSTANTTAKAAASVKGTLTTTFSVGACGAAGTEIPVTIDGSGTLTTFGATKVHIDAKAVCGQPGLLDAVKAIAGTYTNDKGDTMTFSGDGSKIALANSILSFQSADRITGGTARYAGWSGTQNVTYSHPVAGADMTTMSMEVTGEAGVAP